jgi:hypothetical protein
MRHDSYWPRLRHLQPRDNITIQWPIAATKNLLSWGFSVSLIEAIFSSMRASSLSGTTFPRTFPRMRVRNATVAVYDVYWSVRGYAADAMLCDIDRDRASAHQIKS